MYDVIVVGARCAGAPLAMLLAPCRAPGGSGRSGLVSRATRCRPISCGSGAPPGCKPGGCSIGWRARGCVPIREDHLRRRPGAVCRGIGPAVGGVTETYCPRRTVLDALLVEAAAESGAELIDGFVVDGLLWSEGRVVGVEGHAARVGEVDIAGTDRRGRGRSALDRGPSEPVPAATGSTQLSPGFYYSYWSGLSDLGRVLPRPPRSAHSGLAHQRGSDVHLCCMAARRNSARCARTWKASFRAALDLVPGLARGRRNRAAAKSASSAPTTCPTCTGPQQDRVGRWPATPATTRTPRTGMGMSDAFCVSRTAGRCHPRGARGGAANRRCTSRLPGRARRPHRQRIRAHLEHGPARAAHAKARSVLS